MRLRVFWLYTPSVGPMRLRVSPNAGGVVTFVRACEEPVPLFVPLNFGGFMRT